MVLCCVTNQTRANINKCTFNCVYIFIRIYSVPSNLKVKRHTGFVHLQFIGLMYNEQERAGSQSQSSSRVENTSDITAAVEHKGAEQGTVKCEIHNSISQLVSFSSFNLINTQTPGTCTSSWGDPKKLFLFDLVTFGSIKSIDLGNFFKI